MSRAFGVRFYKWRPALPMVIKVLDLVMIFPNALNERHQSNVEPDQISASIKAIDVFVVSMTNHSASSKFSYSIKTLKKDFQ